jgi:hypothetical protein
MNHGACEAAADGASQPDEHGLAELRRLLAALLARSGHGQLPQPDHGLGQLDSMTAEERTALAGQVARRLLRELDRHLAAGRLLDLGILEQRAG